MNPFLDNHFSIAWSQLTPEHIVDDITTAIAQAQERIDAIAAQADDSLTFANTFLAYEHATDTLSDAWGKVGHLDSVCNSDALREAYNQMLPQVSAFYSDIPLNEQLWHTLSTAQKQIDPSSLNPTQQRYLQEVIDEFTEHGAQLSPEDKATYKALSTELAQTTQKYSENVLDSTNQWELLISDPEKLAGLPPSARDAAQQDALAKGHGSDDAPQWRFTLHAPSMLPVLTYADSGELRQQIWQASSRIASQDKYDNEPLIRQILNLRQRKAELLGKPHFADLVLKKRMAQTGQAALDFTQNLFEHSQEPFAQDIAHLSQFRQEQDPSWDQQWQPWDIAYWSEKQRQALYDFDEEELRPYFSVDAVVSGMFALASTLFGIRIEELPTHFADSPTPASDEAQQVWHPQVKYFAIYDQEDGRHMGSFYSDWHPRESKRAGAWMNCLKTGGPQADGSWKPHLGLICGNMTAPLPDKPALLTHREVETIFHEFGHLIHHLLGEVEIPSLNGIHVAWDFVELPSQIMENWCWQRESLDRFARHYQSGEPIPQELLQKMQRARNFQSAMATMRQLSLGKMDLDMHIQAPEASQAENLDQWIRDQLDGYLLPFATTPPSIARRFTHLFADSTGYAAGYYSYKWAEVLDADAFTRFSAEGILNANTGRCFRKEILSQGNSQPPETLFKNFMGRDPDVQALLVRSGLVAES